jgi:hypothetical protein
VAYSIKQNFLCISDINVDSYNVASMEALRNPTHRSLILEHIMMGFLKQFVVKFRTRDDVWFTFNQFYRCDL